ncbi:MAG TPA: 5-formyltetrahydrofolate cyclo-ligase [Phycisphaerae bacterium]|nr:5-formyltetrahydrofolate cyclo-ligase [Phycisphaerae bacterium]
MKRELRDRVRRVLAEIDPVSMAAKSARATELLVETNEFRRAEVIMVFLSLQNELDTTGVVLRSWQDHKRVLAPRVSWEQRRMMPTEIRSLTSDLVETSMGLREPVSGTPIPIAIIDMVIVPGLAFDNQGNRLGRGRGFYDRFLAHPEFKGVTCGLGFEEQYLSEVPVNSLDRPVAMLVTDARVRRFARQRRPAKGRQTL